MSKDRTPIPRVPLPPDEAQVSAAELAGIYDAMTVVVDNDEATTFTDDLLYAAAGRLVDALTTKLIAAHHIRGGRPASDSLSRYHQPSGG